MSCKEAVCPGVVVGVGRFCFVRVLLGRDLVCLLWGPVFVRLFRDVS